VPLGVKCPKCKTGDIIEIRARGRGRPFYGCTNYQSEQKCDFRIFQKPVIEPCPQCGAEFLVAAGGKKNPILKCANGTCGYDRPYEPDMEDEPSDDEEGGESRPRRASSAGT
jgi:DNA topoisomerase-1